MAKPADTNPTKETLLEALPVPIDIVDERGTVLFLNDAMKKLTEQGAIGKKCWVSYKDDKTQCADCPLREGIAVNGVHVLDIPDVFGGRTFQVGHFGMSYGGKKAVLEIFTDITGSRQQDMRLTTLSSVVEQTADNVVITNLDGVIEYVNPAFERTTGFSMDEAVGKTPRILKSGLHHETFYKTLWNTLLSGKAFRQEFANRRKNGEIFYELQTITPIIDDKGAVIKFVAMGRNITDRRLMEEKLRASEARYRSLFGNMLDGFAYCKMLYDNGVPSDFVYLEVNESFERLTGLKGVAGKRATEAIPGIRESNPELMEIYGRVAASGKAEQFEAFVGPMQKWFSVSVYSPEASHFVAIFENITERKKADDELRSSEERLTMLFEYAPDAYYLNDPRGVIVNGNRAAEQLTGYQREELIGKSLLQLNLLSDEGKLKAAALVARSAGGEPTGPDEFVLTRKDGSRVSAEIRTFPVTIQGQTLILGIARDVTARKLAEARVRELAAIVESSEDAIISKTLEGIILTWNNGAEKTYGYRAEEVIGKPVSLLMPPDRQRELEYILTKVRRGETVEHYETERIRKDGAPLAVSVTVSPIRDERGRTIAASTIARDITERRQAVEALRQSEKELRALFGAMTDVVLVLDDQGRYRNVAPTNSPNLPQDPDQLVGKTLHDVLEKPAADLAVAKIRECLASKRSIAFEYSRAAGDRTAWFEVRFSPLTDFTVFGVEHDITNRRTAEEKIRQSEELFRLISEHVGDMVAVVDRNGRRLYNSPSYKPTLGDPARLAGSDSFQEIHPEDRERIRRAFQETIQTGIGQRAEYRMVLKDGSIREIESLGSPIREADGTVSRIVLVSRDVTEKKKLEQQFLRSQRMESIGTLAAGIAHDLNNVLTPILLGIDSLRGAVNDEAGQRILDAVTASARRGSDIVKQVLVFGRGVQGERIALQMKHVLTEVAKIAKETFPKSIDIETEIPKNLWVISADPTQMHQVVLNLCVNARDAMQGGGTLTMAAENINLDENYARMHLESKPGRYVCVSIADTGTGIPQAIREKVFEPFFTTKDIGKGTGLGLSTAVAIVKSHGGFINLYSETGKGTTFKIYIPADPDAQSAAGEQTEAEIPLGRGEIILFIDDEAAIREITKEALEACGYSVLTARDGAEGVALYAERKSEIRVVVTDMMMPIMDGRATIRALHKLDPGVIVVAASGLAEGGRDPSDVGAKAFIAKPFTADKLLRVLHEVLGSHSHP